MKAIDTNILVRWIVRDDERQFILSNRAIEDGAYVSRTVLVELEWVLRSAFKLSRDRIAVSLENVTAIGSLDIDDPDKIDWAIDRYRQGADWADLFHLIAASEFDNFVTFDRRLKRQAGSAAPLPIELIGR